MQNFSSPLVNDASFCNTMKNINENYLQLINGIFGACVNLICTVVFTKMIQDKSMKEGVFKYLLFKSMVDTYISLRFSLGRLIKCQYCELDDYYFVKLFYWIFCIYIGFSVQLISILCDIASSFNRYRLLTMRFKVFNRISFKLAIGLICTYSFSFYAYKIVGFTIVEYSRTENNLTRSIYILNSSARIPSNLSNQTSEILGYIHSFVRDGLCVFVLLVLNILTLVEIRRAMHKKKNLIRQNSSASAVKSGGGVRNTVIKAHKAQLRLTMMVFTMSSVALISHGLIFIEYFKILSRFMRNNKCMNVVNLMSYELQYSVNFFLYLCFNLNFRKVFFNFFRIK